MIRWRIAIPVVLAAAVVAGCITYMATPVQPQRIETDQRMQALTVPKAPETIPPPKEDDITAYQRAADAILSRAQNAKASAPSHRADPSAKEPPAPASVKQWPSKRHYFHDRKASRA